YTADTEKLTVPTLLMDQADEELFDRKGQMPALYDKLKRRISAAYHTFPGPHYAIYEQNLKESSQKARDWYLEHL
ncbi:MAG: alpha/beta hydrolase, partial [Gammaproteobacteria bacterium]|nr:alpha/beta hydrolase [Gammaproteobacteria bacterium]